MAQFLNMYKVELNNGTAPVVSLRQVYLGDVEANRIGAIVTLNGEPVTLTGTCSGTAILADGSTVALTGALDGNQAYVDLPSGCYSKAGQIQVFVKLTVSGVTTTLLAAVGTVRITETDTVIDPGTIIPSVAALIEDIEEARASIHANYSALLATIAPNYEDVTFPVSAGQWCWYSGVLYAANQDISTSENWTAAHWTAVTVGGEAAALKSALTFDEYLINDGTYTIKADDLESGQWSYSSKAFNVARARTQHLLPVRAGMTITYANTTFDTFFGVLETPTSQTYIQTPGWKTDGNGTISITQDGWLTFVIRNHADTSATVNPSDYNSTILIKTGNRIDIDNEGISIEEYNSFNVLGKYLSRITNATSAGVTFAWKDGKCNTSGTSTGDALTRIFWVDRYHMPDGIKTGRWYHVEYETSNQNVMLNIILYANGEIYKNYYFINSGDIEIANDVEGMQVRLYVDNGKSAESGAVTKIGIISEKTNSDIASNVNGKLLSFGNSIMTGTVFINGVRDHRSCYDNAPYGCVATALGIPMKNVTHNIHSDTGLVTGPTTTFLDEIEDADITGYDYLLTHYHTSDLSTTDYTLGNMNSTAGDGTFVGAVLEILNYITTNNSQCRLILIAPPPVLYTYTGNAYYTHKFPCGSTPIQIDDVMNALATRERFIYVGWQELLLMDHYQDYTDGDNIHANNEATYRAMGEYLGVSIYKSNITAKTYLRDLFDVDNITYDSVYFMNITGNYQHVPKNGMWGDLRTTTDRASRNITITIQTAEYSDGDRYIRKKLSTENNFSAWVKETNRTSHVDSGKYVILHDTAFIKNIIGNAGNVVMSTKNLFHLVPSIESSNGIEWTENSDGSITFSGTATAKASFKLFDTNDTQLPCTQYYTVSFGREGDDYQQTDIGYALYVCEYNSENQWVRQIQDIGEGISFLPIQGNRYTIVIKIESGVSISDLKCAFQIEFGEKKTAFVKHQHTSFPVGTTYTNRMFDGENILYSENSDTDITVEYTDIEYNTADKNDLLFSISDPAQGTETEDPGVVFRRIKDTCISGTYKLLTDYRSYDTSAFSVITDEFGFGVRQYSSGNNRSFSSNSRVSSIGNYICVPIFVENLDNLDVVRFSIADTSSKYAVFDIKDELHEGINWFITNLYLATLTSGFDKNSIASVSVRTQAKINRSEAVTWGVFHTYDFRPMCTYIFDDGWYGCATYTAPTMAAHGFRGVFAVPTGKIGADAYHMNEAQLKSLVDGGNDVISHTRDHVNLVTLTPTRQEYQIRKAREYLIQHAPGRNAYYFAPPNVNMINGVRFHERVEPVMNRNATVIKRNDDKFTMLPNLHPELTYCWGTNNTKWEIVFPTRVHTPAQMKAKIDIAIEYGLWVQFGMHYFTDSQDGFFDRDGWLKSDFEEVMDYLDEHSTDIDVVTYRQAYDRM